jgi:hypothetical protein
LKPRLREADFDVAAINAEVLMLAQASFGFFDGLMQSAQIRRLSLLREIALHRERAGYTTIRNASKW